MSNIVPNFEERMKEEIARSKEEMSQRNQQGETSSHSSLSSARAAHERAQERLARVSEPGMGFRNYSHQDREEARKNAQEKEREYRKASNEHARSEYLQGLEDKKAAEAEVRVTRENAQRAENEGRLKESMRRVYPGSNDQFEKDFPLLLSEHYRRQTLDQMNRPPVARF